MTSQRTALLIATTLALSAAPPVATAVDAGPGVVQAGLPLGPAGLSETRTTRTLQPGVTLTTIVRGTTDPAAAWTVEVAIPSGSVDPDAPPAAIKDEAAANAAADQLSAAGLDVRVEAVPTPRLADAGGNVLGYRVRVGSVPTKADADALRTQVIAAGFAGSSVYTGWDGEPDDVAGSTGPWHVQVLTIDPRTFTGELTASYGPDLERRETTSALAAFTGATAAVNAGFFVLDPAAGAPGDPAGVGAYDGRAARLARPGRRTPAGRSQPRTRPDPQLRRQRRHPDRPPIARLHLHGRRRADRLRLLVRRVHAQRAGDRGRARPVRPGARDPLGARWRGARRWPDGAGDRRDGVTAERGGRGRPDATRRRVAGGLSGPPRAGRPSYDDRERRT